MAFIQNYSLFPLYYRSYFNEAIERKQTAIQNALTQKNVLEQKKYEAEQVVITAKAQADAAKLANTPKSAEEKVASLIKDGVISVSQLEQALGREPQYPTEKVGSIKLKKQYLKPFYEVVY